CKPGALGSRRRLGPAGVVQITRCWPGHSLRDRRDGRLGLGCRKSTGSCGALRRADYLTLVSIINHGRRAFATATDQKLAEPASHIKNQQKNRPNPELLRQAL